MKTRNWILLGLPVVVGVVIYACSGSDSGSSSSDAAGSDTGADTPKIDDTDGTVGDGTTTDGTGSSDSDGGGETGTDGDGAKIDTAEYCPNPLYPPRTDGCPCNEPEIFCKESEIGKVCDYFAYCPSKPGNRYECKWLYPAETGLPSDTGKPYAGWVSHAIACPGGG